MPSTIGRIVVVAPTNKTGVTVVRGDVVVFDSANNDSFTTTTTGAFTGAIGVVMETIPDTEQGRVLISGYASLVNVNASVTRGHYLKTHTVAKQATDAGTSRVAGTFGQVLTGGTTPTALIWQPDLGASVSTVSGFSLSPSSDTWIDSQNATTNNDSGTTLTIGNKWGTSSFSRFGLMTFDTSSLAGKTIYRAVLQVVRTDTNALTATTTYLQARRVLRAYNPTQVTWNVYSTGNNWTTAGAQSAGNDVGTEAYGILPLISAPGLGTAYMHMDITALLQVDLDASSSTLRFILGMSNADGSINAITLASKDHGTAAYRPKLLVVAS